MSYYTIDPVVNGQRKQQVVKVGDTLPIGAIIEYDTSGTIPDGWEIYTTGKIKKIAPVTPANGNIANAYGTSQTDTYSQEYLNGKVSDLNNLMKLWGCEELGNKNNTYDANNCQPGQSFYWSIGNTPSNVPISAGRIYCFQGYGSAGKVQICFNYETNSNRIYFRTYFGSWGNWYYISMTQVQ